MARPAQYSRGRQLVLHGALVVVLASTLGLAALLTQSRNRASAIELTAKPHWAGKLAIRVPKGWALNQDTNELPVTVIAQESDRAGKSAMRSVLIHQSSSSANSPENVLARYLSKTEGDFGTLHPFSFLGQPAVYIRGEILESIPGDPFGRSIQIPAWFAATLVPGAAPDGQNLAVVLGVQGQSMSGPAGKRVIDQLAEGLSLRPEQSATALENE